MFLLDDNDCYDYEVCRINFDQKTGKISPGRCQVSKKIMSQLFLECL